MPALDHVKIGLIGLGYVGLPLAVAFGRHYETVGFDINPQRIKKLKEGVDHTREVEPNELREASQLSFTDSADGISDCNVYIVTVPTPIDTFKKPDLQPLESASRLVGALLKEGDTVIYESTVYPGATEEICVPILEMQSGLKFNSDFYAGYSPERINPGDKAHRVTSILKVTSGSTPQTAEFIDELYASVIEAGTYKASSIKVAEAAKVIENTQRDVNIALVNELALIFERLKIDTLEVLEAAGTKWNFLPFRPGLVGGHCIGVDPYYLTHKAQSVGYHPEVILSGRRINDSMGDHVAERVIKLMTRRRIHVVDANILILGLTFKENCPDIRNTRVVDLVSAFQTYNANVDLYDPWADVEEVRHEYGLELTKQPKRDHYDAIILAVGHQQFRDMGAAGIRALGRGNHVLFDVKYILDKEEVDDRL